MLNAAVRNAKLGAGLEGCQTGLGIFAQSSGGGTSDVTLEGTSVHDYQKNGITGNEPGTFLIAKTNRVTGWGPTPYIAQKTVTGPGPLSTVSSGESRQLSVVR